MLDPLTVRFGRFFASIRDDRRGRAYPRRRPNEATQRNRNEMMRKLFGGNITFDRQQEYVRVRGWTKNSIRFDVVRSAGAPASMAGHRICARSGTSNIVYIEEPEAHLFPTAQSQIIEFLASIISDFSLATRPPSKGAKRASPEHTEHHFMSCQPTGNMNSKRWRVLTSTAVTAELQPSNRDRLQIGPSVPMRVMISKTSRSKMGPRKPFGLPLPRTPPERPRERGEGNPVSRIWTFQKPRNREGQTLPVFRTAYFFPMAGLDLLAFAKSTHRRERLRSAC